MYFDSGKGVTHSMKKGFAVFFSLMLVVALGLTACQKKEEAAPPAEAPAAPAAPEAPAPEAPAPAPEAPAPAGK
jgi:hypothetical protein